jgi:hypothetical protein
VAAIVLEMLRMGRLEGVREECARGWGESSWG